MSKRYSGKSFKDSSVMKKAKLTLKEKRKIKKEKKLNKSRLSTSSWTQNKHKKIFFGIIDLKRFKLFGQIKK